MGKKKVNVEDVVQQGEPKEFFRSDAKTVSMVLKEPKIQYSATGVKIILEPAITVKFLDHVYFPKNEEETTILRKLCERKPYIKCVSVVQQKKERDIEIAKARAQQEVEEKYKEET